MGFASPSLTGLGSAQFEHWEWVGAGSMGNSLPAGRRINPHYLINCLNNNESGICVSSAHGCRDMSETAKAAQRIQELKIPPIPIFSGREQLHRVGPGAPSSQDAAAQLFGNIVLPGWCSFTWGIS